MDGAAGPKQVKTSVFKRQMFNIALVVGHSVLKRANLNSLPGRLQQFGRHVQGGHGAFRSDDSRQELGKAPGARSRSSAWVPGEMFSQSAIC